MPYFNLRYFMEKLGAERKDTGFVLQIGAMDGKTFDPVYEYIQRYGWSGLLVEPMEEPFEALKALYSDHPNIALANEAIAEHSGVTMLNYVPQCHVENGDVPKWGLGVSSFYTDRNALAFETVKPYIASREVSCITLPELLANHAVETIDLFQIDAEGFDYHVLKQLDFNRYRPKVINLEIVNMPKTEQNACKKLLDQYDYIYSKAGYDLLAVSRDFI